ncbi:hypothetical protein [Streptomyces sp. CMB-StM0423]|uniref:hypothetical protein n=1 Tax=Streptomyces sp. CMB-StM0423 TaxID=2059884 RepID=UPI000C701083|nr:hypothetical protein [Streptomyces sp. CMB-StM0423]AUH42117.1 hypothetical protein CXR04_19630 [Streptomyces sp. CMB-StM0423]
MPGTHAASLPRLCRAVIALLAGLAIVVLAPVFACVDAGTPHHEGGESLRGSTLAVALAPVAYAEVTRAHAARHGGERADRTAGSRVDDDRADGRAQSAAAGVLARHVEDHLDDHASHADCSEPCCEPSAALPHAVVRDDPAGSAAHPAPAVPAPVPGALREAGEARAAPPAAAALPAPRPGAALLRLVCVSRT